MTASETQTKTGKSELSFAWLEITGKCQLECIHCYASSGPSGTHGVMTTGHWVSVIGQLADHGVDMVQFIGGEPTLHPDLPALITTALAHGLGVEVFSNLVHIPDALWDVFALPGVQLACSYYSDDPVEHAKITGRPTYHRTKANIEKALAQGIPLRAGVVDMGGGQRATQAVAELVDLGIPSPGIDQLRQVGRGIRDEQASMDQLCGRCADDVLAISPTGDVWPCVFSRWLPVGNVLQQSVADVLASPDLKSTRSELAANFSQRPQASCFPDPCHPDCNPPTCQPNCSPRCSPSCDPCAPKARCWPYYG
jgi:MoaA/NifB/PqqE/SkfB family radical SAM enzyme